MSDVYWRFQEQPLVNKEYYQSFESFKHNGFTVNLYMLPTHYHTSILLFATTAVKRLEVIIRSTCRYIIA